jgi:hypothetical protein
LLGHKKKIPMKKRITSIAFICVSMLFVSSCTLKKNMIREPNVFVELEKDDFELSEQVSAEAVEKTILFVDWQRLTNKEVGVVDGSQSPLPNPVDLVSVPVIGSYIASPAKNYALYNLLQANPGYDVVFYPQFEIVQEKPIIGIGFFKTVTTVKVTARLGKLKS